MSNQTSVNLTRRYFLARWFPLATVTLMLLAPIFSDQGAAVTAQNNFFGANPGGGANMINKSSTNEDDGAAGPGIPLTNGAMPTPAPAGGDYTTDEKRMQKKYHGNLRHAQDLIKQGDQMMKEAGFNKSDKNYKKGLVLKQVGEKSLAELKANNPFDVDKEKPIFAERKKPDVNKSDK